MVNQSFVTQVAVMTVTQSDMHQVDISFDNFHQFINFVSWTDHRLLVV